MHSKHPMTVMLINPTPPAPQNLPILDPVVAIPTLQTMTMLNAECLDVDELDELRSSWPKRKDVVIPPSFIQQYLTDGDSIFRTLTSTSVNSAGGSQSKNAYQIAFETS